MDEESFVNEFRSRMERHALWRHEYFARLPDAALSVLRTWAIQAGKIDEAFVEILQNMRSNPAMPAMAYGAIEANLHDEQGNGDATQEHFTLFRDVLTVVQVSDAEYRLAAPTPGTAAILSHLRYASIADPLQSLSLMASEELICPTEFPYFVDAFRRHDQRRFEYFDVHIRADIAHADDLIRLCYAAARNDADLERVFSWQEADLNSNVRFYDSLLALWR